LGFLDLVPREKGMSIRSKAKKEPDMATQGGRAEIVRESGINTGKCVLEKSLKRIKQVSKGVKSEGVVVANDRRSRRK